MTHKDHVLIASLLNKWIIPLKDGGYTVAYRHASDVEAKNIFEAFANQLGKGNTQFNKKEFIEACQK
jgi:hypothetical protein